MIMDKVAESAVGTTLSDISFLGIMFKSLKDSHIINKCVYLVLGIDMKGQKDILGILD